MNNLLTLREVKRLLSLVDNRSVKKFCQRHGIEIFYTAGSNQKYISSIQFYLALEKIKSENGITLGQLQSAMKVYSAHLSEKEEVQKERLNNNTGYIPRTESETKNLNAILDFGGSHAIMADSMSNGLFIPPKKRGVAKVVVYCKKCSRNCYDLCHLTKASLKRCIFGRRHKFKCYVYQPGTLKRRTKFLKAKNYNDAIVEAIAFEKQVKENNISQPKKGNTDIAIPKEKNKPVLLKHLAARYSAYLEADTELFPEVLVRVRSKSHVRDVNWVIREFAICLSKNNFAFNELKPEDIGISEINLFHNYILKERQLSPRSFNKSMTILSSFYKFLNEVEKIKIENPFSSIPHKSLNSESKINVPSESQIWAIIEMLKLPELGKVKVGEEVKDLYREWMPDLVKLAAFSGRRNEEICRMKFSDIRTDREGNLYIRTPDFKVNRIRNLQGDDTKYIPVPVTQELFDLLLELGYEEYKGADRYLIANDDPMSRETMKHFISRSFSHYAKYVDSENPITLKSLRKKYITELSKFLGLEQARQITKHSNTKIMESNYIDSKVLSAAAKDFNVFGNSETAQKSKRENDLQQIREQKAEQPEIYLNK